MALQFFMSMIDYSGIRRAHDRRPSISGTCPRSATERLSNAIPKRNLREHLDRPLPALRGRLRTCIVFEPTSVQRRADPSRPRSCPGQRWQSHLLAAGLYLLMADHAARRAKLGAHPRAPQASASRDVGLMRCRPARQSRSQSGMRSAGDRRSQNAHRCRDLASNVSIRSGRKRIT